jgi:CRISPR-associated protein Cas2
LDGIIKPSEDHVLIIEVGPADAVDPRVESLGRPFETIKREAVVV